MSAAPGVTPAEPVWTPRIVFAFCLITLIWGSTWLVIKDQVGTVPPSWSVRPLLIAFWMSSLLSVVETEQADSKRAERLAVASASARREVSTVPPRTSESMASVVTDADISGGLGQMPCIAPPLTR